MKLDELKALEAEATRRIGKPVSISRTLHGTWKLLIGEDDARTCATAQHAAEFLAGVMWQRGT